MSSNTAMQTAHDMAAAVSASYKQPAGSLRQFGRFGAIAVGLISGMLSVSVAYSNKESLLRAAIAERDAKIAELTAANSKLEKAAAGEAPKASSGDPVQDWIDALGE